MVQSDAVRIVTDSRVDALTAAKVATSTSLTAGAVKANAPKVDTVTVGKTKRFDFCTTDYASADLAVQAAVDSLPSGYSGGGSIRIGAGTYDFVNGVDTTAKHHIHISGTGTSTIIRWKNSNVFSPNTADTHWLFTLGDYVVITKLQLVGFATFACTINGVNTFSPGTGTNTKGGGIRWLGGRIWLDQVYVSGMAEDGLTNGGGIGTKYTDIGVIGCGGAGLNITNQTTGSMYATDGDLSSTWIGSCGKGIVVAEGGLWISGAHVWGCLSDGITVNADSVRVIGCYLETNMGWGVNINARHNCVVTACDIWGNGLDFASAAAAKGGVLINAGKFNHITDNNFRDNRYYQILAASTSFDNIIKDNTGTDSCRHNIADDTTIGYTANGTQTATTAFIDNNAPSWMATANKAMGVSVAIAGAGAAGAAMASQVVGWVSTTQVTLGNSMSTVTVNPTYSVQATAYGYRETGAATRNVVKDNNFRHALVAPIALNALTGRNSRSSGNKGVDERSWVEGGTVNTGTLVVDLRSGGVYHATINVNVTAVSLFSGGVLVRGTELTIMVTQDGVGSRTVTGWPASFKFAGGTAPTFPTTAAATGTVHFRYDGINWVETGRSM